jgi:spore maturation protein CgeB
MKLLSREPLTDEQWAVLREGPQLVILAVSSAGGTRLDSLLERAAGQRAVAAGANNDHPLVRAIGTRHEIEAALAAVERRTKDERGAIRSHEELVRLTVEQLQRAMAILREVGGELDLYGYREFIMGVARKVAEAAREDDIFGLGGQQVSDAERDVLKSIAHALSS